MGRLLAAQGYRFVPVTPDTHRLVNARDGARLAASLRDVFGWNRPFEAGQLPAGLSELLLEANACLKLDERRFQSRVRFATFGDLPFVHSAFPTDEQDSVFLGPDSYRFVRAITPSLPVSGRLVDVGCGSGVAGILAARRAGAGLKVVLSDINEHALAMARVNAALAGVEVEIVQSDVLDAVGGCVDVVISNPPFLQDSAHRTYRDGGGGLGTALPARIVRESLQRLARNQSGGLLLMYGGAAVVAGRDSLWREIARDMSRQGVTCEYEELDPDIFGTELESPAYADVERIAAVCLRARVAGRGNGSAAMPDRGQVRDG